jgi:hypothetical protein
MYEHTMTSSMEHNPSLELVKKYQCVWMFPFHIDKQQYAVHTSNVYMLSAIKATSQKFALINR